MAEQREHTAGPAVSRRRRVTTFAIVAAVVAVLALGTWVVIDGTSSAAEVAASDLADEFVAGVSAHDGEAVAALFTENGILEMRNWRTTQGHEAIAADVDYWSQCAEGWDCVGEAEETDTGVFTFAARGEYHGILSEGEGEIEVDGDLIAHLTWYGHHAVEQ